MFLSESEKRRIVALQEAQVEAMATRQVILHVAPIFWLWIPSDKPLDNLFNPQDPDKLVRRVDAINGTFTFEPERLVLGKTLESISVPLDEEWVLEEAVTMHGIKLPLRSHMTAPNIHARSSGHQTLEFFNTSDSPLTVKVADLEVVALVLPLTSPSMGAGGTFRHQNLGDNPLPDFRKDPYYQRIRQRLQQNP